MQALDRSSSGKAPSARTDALFDVAVIGAGVVGCAVARRFALAGARVILIEKGPDILSGASKANSAILHTGFDAPIGSLEHELVQSGRQEYLEIHRSMNLPLVETGAFVCAWNEHEHEALRQIVDDAHANSVVNCRLVTAAEVRRAIPGISERLVAALEVPDEHVIDPWSPSLAYLTQAIALGAVFARNTELLHGVFDADRWLLRTSRGEMRAAAVVNAAGLYGDVVDARLGFEPEFLIRPRKGQFVVLDKAARAHVPSIILPVPTQVTKGVVVCPTAFGNVLVGPTAEEQTDRARAPVEHDTLQALLSRAAQIVPALAGMPVTAVYAGLRPATEHKGYRIFCRPGQRAITLGGIRSTGLSSALGLARHALELYQQFGLVLEAPSVVPAVTMPNLAEGGERDWQRPDHGDVVCHCELVTRREIVAALAAQVPPGDFGGLRRRTRAGMGRCQGFYCNAELAAMTRGILAAPLAVDTVTPE